MTLRDRTRVGSLVLAAAFGASLASAADLDRTSGLAARSWRTVSVDHRAPISRWSAIRAPAI